MGLLAPVRGRLLLSLALGALGGACAVAALLLVGLAVGELLGADRSGWTIFWLLGGALVLAVARFVLRKLAFDVSHVASFDLETHLRRDLAEHLGRVPLGQVQRLGSGAIKKVVQDDVRALHTAVADSVPILGGGIAQPVAALAVLAVVDWRMLLAVLAIFPLVAVGFRLVTKDYQTQRRAYDEANEAVNEAVVEFVQGMPVIRTFDDGTTSFTRFSHSVAEFTRATEAWQREGYSAGVLTRAAMTPLPTLVIVAALGTWLVTQGTLAPVDLIIALVVGTLPVESIVPLMYLSDYINQSKAGAARIGEILDIPVLPQPTAPRLPADGSIRFDNVAFAHDWPDGPLALSGVSFEIPSGSVCALVGAGGTYAACGATTSGRAPGA
jgi:ATP-binding cassette, subfamily B, bacterial IrtA/YbtP